MKPEAIPFYGVGVAILLALIFGVENYLGHTFVEVKEQQYCRPQINPDEFRWGRVGPRKEASEFAVNDLVRYRTQRTKREITSRVIATQGQRVKIEKGKILVDGAGIEDKYSRGRIKGEFLPELIVPTDCIFVVNDQRARGSDRMDSRNFGPISVRSVLSSFSPKDLVKGR
jgi:signal peptidase I